MKNKGYKRSGTTVTERPVYPETIADSTCSAQLALTKCILYASVFAVSFFLFYSQANSTIRSDLKPHLRMVDSLPESISEISHPGFHVIVWIGSKILNVSTAFVAVYFLSGAVVLTVYAVHRILRSILEDQCSELFLLFVSLMLILVAPLYCPFFNLKLYLGQGSPNTWHSPTQIAYRPFILLTFHLFPLLFNSKIKRKTIYCILASIMLLIATFIKPNFALFFLPAAGIYLLLHHTRNIRAYAMYAAMIVPTIILLVIQCVSTFGDDKAAGIEMGFFKIWTQRTSNVPISVLLTIAFPLSILIFCPRKALKDRHLLLAWLCYGIAFCQRGFLYESGWRIYHGNFGWGYNLALFLLFIYSMALLLKWFKQADCQKWTERMKLIIATSIFSLHTVSGAYYICKYLSGHGYA